MSDTGFAVSQPRPSDRSAPAQDSRLIVVNLDPDLHFSNLMRQVALDLHRRREIQLWDAAPTVAVHGALLGFAPMATTTGRTADADVDPWRDWPRHIAGGVAGVVAELTESIGEGTGGDRLKTEPITVLVIAPAAETSSRNPAPGSSTLAQLAKGLLASRSISDVQRRRMTMIVLAQSMSKEAYGAVEPCIGASTEGAQPRFYDAVVVWDRATAGQKPVDEHRRETFVLQIRLVLDLLYEPGVREALQNYLSPKKSQQPVRLLTVTSGDPSNKTHRQSYVAAVDSQVSALNRASAEPRDQKDRQTFDQLLEEIVEEARKLSGETRQQPRRIEERKQDRTQAPPAADGTERPLTEMFGIHPISKPELTGEAAPKRNSIPPPTLFKPFERIHKIDQTAFDNLKALFASLDLEVERRIEGEQKLFARAEADAIRKRRQLVQRFAELRLTELGTEVLGRENQRNAEAEVRRQAALASSELDKFRAKNLAAKQRPEILATAIGDSTARWLNSVDNRIEAVVSALTRIVEAATSLPGSRGAVTWWLLGLLVCLGVPLMWLGWRFSEPKAVSEPWPVVGFSVWLLMFCFYWWLPVIRRFRASERLWQGIRTLDERCVALIRDIDTEIAGVAGFFGLAQQQVLLRQALHHLQRLERDRLRVTDYTNKIAAALRYGRFGVVSAGRSMGSDDQMRRAKDAQLDLRDWLPWALDTALPLEVPVTLKVTIAGGDSLPAPSTFFSSEVKVTIEPASIDVVAARTC